MAGSMMKKVGNRIMFTAQAAVRSKPEAAKISVPVRYTSAFRITCLNATMGLCLFQWRPPTSRFRADRISFVARWKHGGDLRHHS